MRYCHRSLCRGRGYSTLLSHAEVEEVKKNQIVLDVEKDRGDLTIENFQLELEAAAEKMKKEFRDILKAVVGDLSSGISPQTRKSISDHMKEGTGQFPWVNISEIDLDVIHSEIARKAGYVGELNRMWKNNWHRTRNSTITYLLSEI